VFVPGLLDELRKHVDAGRTFVAVNTASVADEEVKYTLSADGYIDELSKTVVGGLGEAVGINYVAADDRPVLIEHLDACADQDYFELGIETAAVEEIRDATPEFGHGERSYAVRRISWIACVMRSYPANSALSWARPCGVSL